MLRRHHARLPNTHTARGTSHCVWRRHARLWGSSHRPWRTSRSTIWLWKGGGRHLWGFTLPILRGNTAKAIHSILLRGTVRGPLGSRRPTKLL